MATAPTEPPAGVHHYDESSEMPDTIQKYWHQRYDIFSRYDEGIWMTDDLWFGVTPEPVAKSLTPLYRLLASPFTDVLYISNIADHVGQSAPASKTILIDAFAGAGGNAIAFALSGRWDRIFAIEKDPVVLACGKHNAAVYGVENKIWWIQGDCFDVLKKRLKPMAKDALLFASPPWGGPSYGTSDVFDLATMQPYSLRDLYLPFTAFAPHLVLYLPRSSDLNQVAKYATDGRQLEVTHYCMHGASKAICVFFGDFDFT